MAYHLADLLHNVVLEMENAAEGEKSYDDVLAILNERASELGLERWLESTLATINGAESKDGQ